MTGGDRVYSSSRVDEKTHIVFTPHVECSAWRLFVLCVCYCIIVWIVRLFTAYCARYQLDGFFHPLRAFDSICLAIYS